jgi:hypothetical protein
MDTSSKNILISLPFLTPSPQPSSVVLSKIAAKEKLTDDEIMHTFATFNQVLTSALEEK